MLYLINDKYYMLRNREYVSVDLKLDNNELVIKPNREYVIEANDDVKIKSILIDDIIKSLKKESNKYDKSLNNYKINRK